MATLEFGYWKIRGLGAVCRMILEYKEVQFEDKQYADGDAWFKGRKPELLAKNPLANLPYLVDGDKVVCQTNSIMNYLGEKFKMCGTDEEAKLKNNQLLCEIYDVRNGMIDLVYPFKQVTRNKEEFEALAIKKVEDPPFAKFEAWLNFYKTDFFCGAEPVTCDFHIWEMLDQHEMLAKKMGKPSILDKFPKCHEFYKRFRALPTLQKYFASDSYKLDVNNQLGGAWFY
ncbi:hypothetical protein GUITHDRAFT_160740 [Guillardia theta CCMP2712]|uniref:glutathione transferase n=1 Tax=Guillardia theta (strain CCMP2712) TaxID=905079 RepID=L1K0D7_GUITC|nr:hypothetical protein GUITHDRAFT_160740 [Guillardia theta CCMP2712]EKX53910.1 hypothetical protein GUITHDRAFT_160740 [Guillardia theta CCMP2712]|eukprot:XP_005840890.1 hypothetical protein GUITHDRAFT_160740 [Guillardia theta CCMP2712]